jgi:signal transduction histidine kinase
MFDFDDMEQMITEGSISRWKDPEQRKQFMTKLQKDGIVTNYEAETITHTGRNKHLLFSVTLDGDKISGMVMDITEQKMAEIKILEYQKRLKDLMQELTIAEENVRKQIATDLHDHVGQMLTSMRMQMVSITELEENSDLKTQMSGISQGLLNASQATRAAIFDLSPPQLNEIGLFAAVHDWVKEQIEYKHDIDTSITGEVKNIQMDENTRYMAFRCIKELANNVVKHARANNLIVIFNVRDTILEITVQDDGIGFQANHDLLKLKRKSIGLFFIQERLLNMGGEMKISTGENQGTSITLTIPIKNL